MTGGLIAITALWATIAGILVHALSRSGFARKYESSEYANPPKTAPDSFAAWFAPCLAIEWAVVVGPPIVAAFAAVFAPPLSLTPLFRAMLEYLFWDADTVAIWGTQLVWAAVLAPLTIGWGGMYLLVKVALLPFPRLNGYLAVRNMCIQISTGTDVSKAEFQRLRAEGQAAWAEAINGWDLAKYAAAQWRPAVLWTLVPWLLVGPVLMLLINNYVKVNHSGITTNFFPSVVEQRRSWSDVEVAKIYLAPYTREFENGPSKEEIEALFQLEFRDGSKRNLWDPWNGFPPPPEKLMRTADVLVENGVPVRLQLMDDPHLVALLRDQPPLAVAPAESVESVFGYVGTVLAKKCGDDAKAHAVVTPGAGKTWGC